MQLLKRHASMRSNPHSHIELYSIQLHPFWSKHLFLIPNRDPNHARFCFASRRAKNISLSEKLTFGTLFHTAAITRRHAEVGYVAHFTLPSFIVTLDAILGTWEAIALNGVCLVSAQRTHAQAATRKQVAVLNAI